MTWFDNLRLRAKLLSAFSVVVVLAASLGGFAIWQISAVNHKASDISHNWLPSVEKISAVWALTAEVRSTQYRHVTSMTESDMADAEAKLSEKLARLDSARTAFVALGLTAAERPVYEQFKAEWDTYMRHWDEVRDLSRSNRDSEASALLRGDGYRMFTSATGTLQKLVRMNTDSAASAAAAGNAAFVQSRAVILAYLALTTVLSMLLALGLANRMSRIVERVKARTHDVQVRVVRSLREALQAMAVGDLSRVPTADVPPLALPQRDEFGDLARSLDAMIGDVAHTVEACVTTQQAVGSLVSDSRRLAQAAQHGRLGERADAGAYAGSYAEVVQGLNGTLDAVAGPVGEIRAVMGRVADADLTARMSTAYEGEYGAISSSVNTAIESLATTLSQVDAAADQVASAGTQITSSANSLAGGASQQAASLEEVAASVQVVASMSQQTAANAGEARSLAASARADAAEGTARMQRLSEAITDIRASSTETARIVRTIDEIAFQTNLLALNAAVEAARAGDAGRGFAVVAEEVRSLALRAAEAARGTAELIERGQESAGRGVTLNAEVLDSLTSINQRIEAVAAVTDEISAATDHQVEGVTQIQSAMDQINGVTQQVAASAEESASAAAELESQAAHLRDTVARFVLAPSPGDAPTHATKGGVMRTPPSMRPIQHRQSYQRRSNA